MRRHKIHVLNPCDDGLFRATLVDNVSMSNHSTFLINFDGARIQPAKKIVALMRQSNAFVDGEKIGFDENNRGNSTWYIDYESYVVVGGYSLPATVRLSDMMDYYKVLKYEYHNNSAPTERLVIWL